MTIVYDRTKTVVRRHVAPGEAVPLHPEAVGFAGHYDFDIDVLAAYRPTGKGRVERQVLIVRDHVLSGRSFSSIEEMDAAFTAWVPHAAGPDPQDPSGGHRRNGRPGTTRPSGRCRRPRIWWPNGTCGQSARTAWSPSTATSTRCRPAGSALANWSRSGPRSPRSCCMPPSPTLAARRCWPPIPGPSAAVSASSMRRTGTACPPARAAGPPPARIPLQPRRERPRGEEVRAAAGPAEPGRGHPDRGRPPTVVGL